MSSSPRMRCKLKFFLSFIYLRLCTIMKIKCLSLINGNNNTTAVCRLVHDPGKSNTSEVQI